MLHHRAGRDVSDAPSPIQCGLPPASSWCICFFARLAAICCLRLVTPHGALGERMDFQRQAQPMLITCRAPIPSCLLSANYIDLMSVIVGLSIGRQCVMEAGVLDQGDAGTLSTGVRPLNNFLSETVNPVVYSRERRAGRHRRMPGQRDRATPTPGAFD